MNEIYRQARDMNATEAAPLLSTIGGDMPDVAVIDLRPVDGLLAHRSVRCVARYAVTNLTMAH